MGPSRAAVLIALLCAYANQAGVVAIQPKNLPEADLYLKAITQANLFGGMAHVTRGGKVVMSKGYGQASPELGVKMRNDHRFAIGSNTKLFTAVAMWQLHAQKKLNVSEPIDKWIDWKEFNLTGPWCPRLINVTTGPCTVPTITQLLSMQSGLLDTDNCNYYPPDVWQTQYCWSAPKGVALPFAQAQVLSVGAAGPATLLKYWNIFGMPLQYKPGTTYSYVNANFYICAYILEKITGMSTQAYFQKYIFEPAGMDSTVFDISGGNDGIYQGMLELPGYKAYLSPNSLGLALLDFEVLGSASVTGGDIGNYTRKADAAPFGTYVKLAKNNGAFNGFPYGYAHAAGAIVSTPKDMAKWFRVLTRQPKSIGLSIALVKEMMTTGIKTKVADLWYCQGVLTNPNKSLALGTDVLFYQGNLGYDAVTYTKLNATDPSQDLHVTLAVYQSPFTSMFTFAYQPDTSDIAKGPITPMAPSNGSHICYLNITQDPNLYKPSYGSYGGMPMRSKAGFEYFLKIATADNNPAAKGPVAAPHWLCDSSQMGTGIYLSSMIASAALDGAPWIQMAA